MTPDAKRRNPALLVGIVAVVVVIGGTVGLLIARQTTSHKEQTSSEAAHAALVPLSQFPPGTTEAPESNAVTDNNTVSCPGGLTPQVPVDTKETVRPPSGPILFEELQIDTSAGGAALVADIRSQLECGAVQDTTNNIAWTVSTLGVPSLASNEAAYQLNGTVDGIQTITADIIAVPVNRYTALTVGTSSASGSPDINATLQWARQALKRAHAQLDG